MNFASDFAYVGEEDFQDDNEEDDDLKSSLSANLAKQSPMPRIQKQQAEEENSAVMASMSRRNRFSQGARGGSLAAWGRDERRQGEEDEEIPPAADRQPPQEAPPSGFFGFASSFFRRAPPQAQPRQQQQQPGSFSFGAQQQQQQQPGFSFGAQQQQQQQPGFSFGAPQQGQLDAFPQQQQQEGGQSNHQPGLNQPFASPLQEPSLFGAAPEGSAGLFAAPPLMPAMGPGVGESGGANHGNSHMHPGAFLPLPAPAAPRKPPMESKEKRARQGGKVDTNAVAIKLAALGHDADDIFPGDPIFCAGCQCTLSFTSTITQVDAKEAQVWECEFCGHSNDVNVDPEEVPTKDNRDYVLEPAGSVDHKSEAGLVVFVVDISGSMCVTSEIPGTIKLKGGFDPSKLDIPELDGQPVFQRPNRNITYVSRLQCVQAAMDHQMELWAKSSPERPVGLVTFSDEVVLFGDGISEPITIAGDKLNDERALQAAGSGFRLQKGIGETYKALTTKLWALQESGKTALGPALLCAIAMAGESRGAKVVVCTDGLANVGVGALDGSAKPAAGAADDADWYQGVGNLAKLQGVTVDVISITGSECALEDLGTVTEITGGTVTRMDPLELTKEFSSILANPAIATNVSATFILHGGLAFRNEDAVVGNKVTRELGNVTAETELTFEYEIRAEQADKLKHLDAFPFQVQIRYTKLDGMRCLRVLSKKQKITRNRQQAEQGVKLEVVASAVAHKAAHLAEHGHYQEARVNNLRYGKMLQRNAKTEEQQAVFGKWLGEMDNFDSSIQRQQMRASPMVGSAVQSAPAFAMAPSASSSSSPAEAKAMKKTAKGVRDDADYVELRKFKAKSSSAWKK